MGTVNASDNVGVTAYTITTGNSMAFAINAINGIITTANALDYETNSNYSLTVLVADAAGNTNSATITINVSDVDEIAPTITNQTFSVIENVPTNTPVGKVNADDNVGVTAYTITTGNSMAAFAINATNGMLTTANAIDYETNSNYSLTVLVADAAGNTNSATITVNVNNQFELINVANVTDAGSLELDGAQSVTTSVIGGTTYLFVAGFQDDGVSVFSVSDSGALSNVANVTDTSALALDVAFSVTTSVIGGTTYLFVAGISDNGVSVFRVD